MDDDRGNRIIAYNAYPTTSKFHRSKAPFRGIRGPIGSGKTSACINDVMMLAHAQHPSKDGVRRSRVVIVRNCFDSQTEILTESRGWQLFRDLLLDERVAQLADDGFMEFVRPSMHYAAPYVGEMIGFENEGVDFLVTPDHRLNVSKLKTRKKVWGEYKFQTAAECFGSGSYRVKRDAKWNGGNPRGYSEAMFEWLGFWFAEGYAGRYEYEDRSEPRWRCTIVQRKQPEYVRDLFVRAKLEFTESPHGDCVAYKLRVTPRTKPLILELSKTGKATTKRVPTWIKSAPSAHLRAFIDGFVRGDGHTRADCNCTTACTSSRGLADDLQEMAVKSGMVANITLKAESGQAYCINGVSGTTTADFWNLTFVSKSKSQPALKAQGYARKYRGWYRQMYSGMVYCLEVPTHRVYVRRNGRAHWSSQTYGELKSTTIPSWIKWFGENRKIGFGPIVYDTPIRQIITIEYPKNPVHLEVWFMAADRPDHAKKFKSLEATFIWINEACELPWALVETLDGRHGRYPDVDQKPDNVPLANWPTWHGIIADTNPPPTRNWWYQKAEVERPDGWEFFTQPGGLEDATENIVKLPGGRAYYTRLMSGKSQDWIDQYINNQYGRSLAGLPIYKGYWNDRLHVSPVPLKTYNGIPLRISFDFGLTPACAIGQMSPRGQVRILRELCATDMGLERFAADIVVPYLRNEFPGIKIISRGDPGGAQRAQTDEKTCMDILAAAGIPTEPAPTNLLTPRLTAVRRPLSRLVDGEPGFLLDPSCVMLREGFNGGYHFRQLKVAGDPRYEEEPDKNEYSHIHDALQYLCLDLAVDLMKPNVSKPRSSGYRGPADRVAGY